MDTRKEKNSIIIQGTILAVASLVVRIIGLIYRIPMTNAIGDEGIGYYSAAYQVYNVVLILSSYSMPQAVSKLLALRLGKRQYRNARRFFICSIIFSAISGIIFSSLMYFGADFIATKVINMPPAVYALKTLSATVFVVAFLGVFRGFFQGFSTMVPTAVSQIIEQIINAVVSIICAVSLFKTGAKADLIKGTDYYAPALGAEGGTWGTFAGALSALIFIVVIYIIIRPDFMNRVKKEPANRVYKYNRIFSMIFWMVVPIVFSAVIFHMLNLIDNAVFGKYIELSKSTDNYAAIWGIYSGKYQLIINLPVAFATAMASSIIPELSKAVALKNRGEITEKIDVSMRFTTIIAFPSMIGIAILANDILGLLFTNNSNAANGTKMLQIGALAVLVYSTATISNGILQGLGKMFTPVKNALIALVIHLIVMAAGLWLFKGGIYAVLISYVLFALIVAFLNHMSIKQYAHYKGSLMKNYVLPLLASVIMGVSVLLSNKLISLLLKHLFAGHTRLICVFSVCIPVVLGVIVYFILILALKIIDENDLIEMPMGRKIMALGKKMHLL